MTQRFKLIEVSELHPGSSRSVEVDGRRIAVFNVGGTFYAMDDKCPHRGGPLGEGRLDGMKVTCPWHAWQFDVSSGEFALNPDLKVTCYPITIEGDSVMVEL